MHAVTRPENRLLSAFAPAAPTISLRPRNPLHSPGGSAALEQQVVNLQVADIEIRDEVLHKTHEWSVASDGITAYRYISRSAKSISATYARTRREPQFRPCTNQGNRFAKHCDHSFAEQRQSRRYSAPI